MLPSVVELEPREAPSLVSTSLSEPPRMDSPLEASTVMQFENT